ncbi:MAG: hypothetical protein Q9204_001830 [Flavoplaca sp. TL-2023a]
MMPITNPMALEKITVMHLDVNLTLDLLCHSAGVSLTVEERNQAKAQLGVFRRWFHKDVLKPDPSSLSDAILVFPEGKAVPEYRDDAV